MYIFLARFIVRSLCDDTMNDARAISSAFNKNPDLYSTDYASQRMLNVGTVTVADHYTLLYVDLCISS